MSHPPVGPGFVPEPSTPRGPGTSVAPARPRGVGGLRHPRRRGSSARRRARRGPPRHGPGPSAARCPRLASSSRPPHPASGPLCPDVGLASGKAFPSPPHRPPRAQLLHDSPGLEGRIPRGALKGKWVGRNPRGGPEGKTGAQSAEFVPPGPPCGGEECEETGAARALDGRGDGAGFRQGPPSPEAAAGVGSAEVHARSEGLGGRRGRRHHPRTAGGPPKASLGPAAKSHTSPRCKEVLSWSRLPTRTQTSIWDSEYLRHALGGQTALGAPDGLGDRGLAVLPACGCGGVAVRGARRLGHRESRIPRHHRRQNHSRRG